MLELFKELISTPSPSGKERAVQTIIIRELDALQIPYRLDEVGNVWARIGEKPRTLFTAHMDCVHNDEDVLWEIDDKGIMSLQKDCKQRALGADDKAGIAILLHMMNYDVEALYLFTVKEEVGCVGAKHAAKNCPKYINQAICFDRKANTSIITSMFNGDCCSKEFTASLIAQFDKQEVFFMDDPTGSTTDTAQFIDSTLNHTNISAGYLNEHTKLETVDTIFLQKLMEAATCIEWDKLSDVKRPKKVVHDYWANKRGKTRPNLWLCDSGEEAITSYLAWLSTQTYVSIKDQKGAMETVLCVIEWDKHIRGAGV